MASMRSLGLRPSSSSHRRMRLRTTRSESFHAGVVADVELARGLLRRESAVLQLGPPGDDVSEVGLHRPQALDVRDGTMTRDDHARLQCDDAVRPSRPS